MKTKWRVVYQFHQNKSTNWIFRRRLQDRHFDKLAFAILAKTPNPLKYVIWPSTCLKVEANNHYKQAK